MYPESGDTAKIALIKPFLSTDKFRFVAKKGYIDNDQAKADLDKIKVVPNPYLANALWEERNPYSSGRGPRSIHFTHLPNQCTIRIFTVSGELVQEIQHESNLTDGAAEWDLVIKRQSLGFLWCLHLSCRCPGNWYNSWKICNNKIINSR